MNEASLPAGGSDIAGAASPGAVSRTVETLLSRIARHEERLCAFTHVMADEARRQAAVLDALDPAERGPLHGMVVSIKDIIDVEGVATTCGSRSRLDRVAERDATLVARLRRAGAVIVGKANCHEFAFGGPAFDLPFPPARNPWDDELFPGGSSSGSGVSVAAGFCHASIGSDTAGSIRLPSSHCGIVGLKIGNGRVPLDGMCALSPSLDSVGPMALSVAHCAAIYAVIVDGNGNAAGAEEAAAPRLAIPEPEWIAALGCSPDSLAAYERACAIFRADGIAVSTVPLPSLRAIHAASSVVMMREVADGFAAEVRRDYLKFGEVFRNRVLLGERIPGRAYALALRQCRRLAGEIARALGGISALLLPGYPVGPTPLTTVDKFYFLQRENLNVVANCAGAPTLSLPVLRDAARRPLGIQLMGGSGGEPRLLALGKRLERLLAYPHQLPFPEAETDQTKKGE
ncbi:amidase [Gemmobacter nectariphilus]|uniref:amidase n=1 Tax=Gemmobacter nectariphilus TaxID=220343 RepID=UPI000414FEF2|nr:amidase [Gemmobacter nectariphilus]